MRLADFRIAQRAHRNTRASSGRTDHGTCRSVWLLAVLSCCSVFDYAGPARMSSLVLATVGMFMVFNVGGNDVANSFNHAGARTPTMKQALRSRRSSRSAVIAGATTETIRSGIVGFNWVFVDLTRLHEYHVVGAIGSRAYCCLPTAGVDYIRSIIGRMSARRSLGMVMAMHAATQDGPEWINRQIVVSWVLSPGDLVSYLLYGVIKRHILLYNEQAERRLTEAQERAHRTIDAAALDRLTEIQHRLYWRPGVMTPSRQNQATLIPTNWDPITTAGYTKSTPRYRRSTRSGPCRTGSAVPAGIHDHCRMPLFKWVQAHALSYHDDNYFIIAMVGAAVGWPPRFRHILSGRINSRVNVFDAQLMALIGLGLRLQPRQ